MGLVCWRHLGWQNPQTKNSCVLLNSVCLHACLFALFIAFTSWQGNFLCPPLHSCGGVITRPLLPVAFPRVPGRCSKWALHLASSQLSVVISLLTSDRRALGPQQQLGNPNVTWHSITQLSGSCKHEMPTWVCPRGAGTSSPLLSPWANFLLSSCFLSFYGSRLRLQKQISPTSSCMYSLLFCYNRTSPTIPSATWKKNHPFWNNYPYCWQLSAAVG